MVVMKRVSLFFFLLSLQSFILKFLINSWTHERLTTGQNGAYKFWALNHNESATFSISNEKRQDYNEGEKKSDGNRIDEKWVALSFWQWNPLNNIYVISSAISILEVDTLDMWAMRECETFKCISKGNLRNDLNKKRQMNPPSKSFNAWIIWFFAHSFHSRFIQLKIGDE